MISEFFWVIVVLPYLIHKQPVEVFYKKKVFLNISQNSQENTCARVSFLIMFIKKKRLWHRSFPVNFAKVLRTSFLQNTSRWLPLLINIFLYLYFSVGFPCPVNYNPADHYVHTLAIIPGNEEECKAKANVRNFFKKLIF